MKTIFTLIIGLLISLHLFAQKQANYWYFGHNAGISFAMGPPAPLTNGAIYTGEGCSSISTATGTLEFYTDGQFVYNKNHQQMPNGSGLFGHSSSTQSGIIVPKPLSTTEYYIFTVDAADNGLAHGLCYSKVDMTLDNGLGDVVPTEKNISLVPLACEKVTAVGHSDGYTFWVITKKWGNADFYAYRITPDGVLTEPVISTTGPPLTGNIGQDSKGYLKVSPDGTKIAAANNTKFNVGIYSFNNASGIIEHIVTDNNYTSPGGYDPGGPYGVEFSPNSKRLYIGEWKGNRKIHQYDLSLGTPDAILASRVVVASVGQGSDPIGALQLGPDNRLYIARQGSNYLSRINLPNALGAECQFVENGVNLANRESTYGLPPFIQSFFYLSADFYWNEPACTGYPTQFYTSASDDPDSVKWTFPGGINSTELEPSFHFTTPGFYGVQLVVYLYGQSKNVSHFVRVGTTPELNLGNDSTFCLSEAFYLDAGDYSSYLWHDSTTLQTILTDTTGWYKCTVTNESGCPVTDSIYFIVHPNPEPYAGPVKSIPEGTTTVLEGEITGTGTYSYHWEPADLLQDPDILQPTTVEMLYSTLFTLTVTDLSTGCTGQDTVFITVTGGPLGCLASASPLTICRGEQSQLNVTGFGGNGGYTYTWTSNPPGFNSALTNPTVMPTQTTTYYVTVSDGQTTANSSVVVTVKQLPDPDAGPDQVITYGTSTILHGSVTQGTGPYQYIWEPANKLVVSNIQNPTTVNLYASTAFSLSVSDLGTGCESEYPDVVTVSLEGSALSASPEAQPGISCSGDQVQLFALGSGGTQNYTYKWSSNPAGFSSTSSDPLVSPTVTTTYTVIVDDGFNTATGSITVMVNPLPAINLLPQNDPKIQIISPTEIGVCVFDSVTINAGNNGCDYFWSNGSTAQSICVQTSGITFDLQGYDVQVTDPVSGCSNDAHIDVYFTFTNCSYGLNETESDNKIRFYPNPSEDGVFNCFIEDYSGDVCFEFFTSQGSLISKQNITVQPGVTNKFSLDSGLRKQGIYFVKVTRDSEVYIHKILIK